MISVIVPTNRVGGLDVLFASLGKQTYRDFELLLVDSLGGCNRPRRIQSSENIYWTAFEPRDNPFPAVAYCRTMNTGISHARGDTILMLCDYSWLHPDCLATHAEMQAKHRGPVTLDYSYVGLPPLKRPIDYREKTPGTPELAAEYTAEVNANSDRYAADVAAGRLDDLMWSIFAEPVTTDTLTTLPLEHEHRPSRADLSNDWNWCSCKNESFPTELLLEMNGLNEAFDLSHCYQDSDLSYRLREMGIRWHSCPGGEVTVLNPRGIMNIKRLAKPLFYNRDLCFGEWEASKRRPVNPEFSLREWRCQVVNQ